MLFHVKYCDFGAVKIFLTKKKKNKIYRFLGCFFSKIEKNKFDKTLNFSLDFDGNKCELIGFLTIFEIDIENCKRISLLMKYGLISKF